MSTPIVDKVIEQMAGMPNEMQWRVLEFTRALALSSPRGVAGSQILRFAGAIASDDLERMREAIEQGVDRCHCAAAQPDAGDSRRAFQRDRESGDRALVGRLAMLAPACGGAGRAITRLIRAETR